MTIHLPKEVENSINAAVHRGHFASVDDAMTEAAHLLLQKLNQGQAANTNSEAGETAIRLQAENIQGAIEEADTPQRVNELKSILVMLAGKTNSPDLQAVIQKHLQDADKKFKEISINKDADRGHNAAATVPADKPIWEEILELTADVPDEVWDSLPADLAEQHDHYIYGTPKRPTS